jgi:hypothetical protein
MLTAGSYEALLNAIPMPAFIVDEDLVVNNVNHAAIDVFNLDGDRVLFDRLGSALRCANAFANPAGCGSSAACEKCVMRNSVAECFAGPPIIQRKTILAFHSQEAPSGCELLITVNQIMNDNHIYALFMIEDMTKLSLSDVNIPVCMHCNKLRGDDNQWSSIENFLDGNLHIRLTHCICESCLGKYYPDIADKKYTCH